MHLKSLTLRGFKSFASATTLNLEPGITCIVGPNGSGKSNVVDALSWVMGEQGAKSLRGGKMEDVIFAGTSTRAPLGRSEVQLTIDNSDGTLPIDYTEVTISRTMFRSGGSEYAINAHPVRLLDVQELLSDTGMGNEMHVIVGQGRLDSILNATPEARRGFIEEAAGILKHRKRKEKALRKLEATQMNLDRLTDLIAEIRRQLKPLGRQAQAARRAATIQAELRDARARLLADDLVTLQAAIEADAADERSRAEAIEAANRRLEAARDAEAEAERALAAASPALEQAQEDWYALASLRERVSATLQIAHERVRHARDSSQMGRVGRDPDELEAEASRVEAEERSLLDEAAVRRGELERASADRAEVEACHAAAEQSYAAALRVIADRREGLARLSGKVDSLTTKLEAGAAELERLTASREDAARRAAQADHDFAELEAQVVGLNAGEAGLDDAYEAASARVAECAAVIDVLNIDRGRLTQALAGLEARVEVLRGGLDNKDGAGELLAASDRLAGVLGPLAGLIDISTGWEAAVAAALGEAADAVGLVNLDAAEAALGILKSSKLGNAGLVIAGPSIDRSRWPRLPDTAVWLADQVTAQPGILASVTRLLSLVAGVADLEVARELVSQLPDVTAVTRDGDVISAWYVRGGAGSSFSRIEVQAALDEAESQSREAAAELDRVHADLAVQRALLDEARRAADAALDRLNDSDAQLSAITERLGVLGQAGRAARTEADRYARAIEQAKASQACDEQTLAELSARREAASTQGELTEPDPAERDGLSERARAARQAEFEARLSLRTAEERAKALAGRADALRRAASAERATRAKVREQAERLAREATVAAAVVQGAQWLLGQVNEARANASVAREQAELARREADHRVSDTRRATREVLADLDQLTQGAHRDEMVRVEQQMRLKRLTEKALDELGMTPEVLVAEYGPDQLVPIKTRPDGSALADDDEHPDPVAYVRAQQVKRLQAAEKDLQLLGRVNPLALEEFDAMQERHRFLASQLEDLKKTRAGLLGIVDEVDKRVEQVFADAYRDVERTFAQVFERLFPGGEGRLVPTEPGQWLTTGVEVEARPAGKKVKRLSLLSGGERSLVAVAFLFSLFIARPSPFYILDEIEAALDDVNLGRLLDIYKELREHAQLLVITHQKRTMEIADALYGVTMRGDGVSTVISQRLREVE